MKTDNFNFTRLILLTGSLLPLMATAGIPMTPGISGSWYNRDQSGHGFVLEVLQGSKLNVYWYAYNLDGNQAWILGVGDIDGDQATVPVYITRGGRFGPDFDPETVERILDWGILSFEFDSCNSGTVTYDVENGSGVLRIERLTAPAGLVCQDSSMEDTSTPDPEDTSVEDTSTPEPGDSATTDPGDASLVTRCANIAGEWNISENVTMNCTISERTTSQSLSVAGTSIIQQNDCRIIYDVPGHDFTRNGTVDGDGIRISNAFLLPFEGNVSVTENTFSAEGTISGDSINVEGSGSATGTVDGERFSCIGSNTITLFPAEF